MSITYKIQQAFNKAKLTYDLHCHMQKKIANQLIAMIASQRYTYDYIADMGCGTGISTESIIKQIKYKKLICADIADQLLDVLVERNLASNILPIVGDMNTLLFRNAVLDLIVSSMSLQWVNHLPKVLSNFYSSLHNQGVVAIAIPLNGSLNEILPAFRNRFLSQKKIADTFQACGLKMQNTAQQRIIIKFDTHLLALRSLKEIGATTITQPNVQKSGLAKKAFSSYFTSQSECQLTYHIGYFIAKKEKS